MFKQYRVRDYDFKLIFLTIALSAIGVIAVGSAKESMQSKQFMGVLLGVFLMVMISFFDYTLLLKLYWLMYLGNLGMLAWVAYGGDKGGSGAGAQRWLEIGGFRFQPSELAKIILILFFAQFIMKHREHLNTFKYICACLVLVAVPWLLIYLQPDLSTSVIVIVIFCAAMFVGGLSYKVIFGILIVIVPAAAIFLSLVLQPDQELLKDYQRNRILAFINPEEYATEEAYQQLNSITAIGSGQYEGKGYKNNEIGSVKNGNYISEPQTDFIFAIIGEEFGFRGSCIVVILFVLLGLECLTVARKARDTAGMIIAAGMGFLVMFQSFFNIGVATFILPNTGLPLPFISNGLTSLVSLYMGMGVVLNVRLQCRR